MDALNTIINVYEEPLCLEGLGSTSLCLYLCGVSVISAIVSLR